MLHGSCLCGDVAFEIDGELELPHACHCTICQKSHGTAYGAYALVDAAHFRFTRGAERVQAYRSSPNSQRWFCRSCGSKVPEVHTETGRVGIPLGTLDDAGTDVALEAHIFVESNPSWNEITDGAPCFDTWPPDFDLPVFPSPQRLPSTTISGSCLCDRVAYELPRPPAGMRHCHCSRCRKARSAPHATNAWTDLAGFRFTRGQDELSSYKVPEARFFSSVFCRTCGAPMPRIDESRDLVIIPGGSFDGDPGVRPDEHIFTGSKAAWFDITDSLPQRLERD